MQVGFIGLGNVGGKLSGSLLRNGVSLQVHDLDEALVEAFVAKGAKNGVSPAEMMQSCDIVITCLPNPAASAAVVQAMLAHVKPGKIWLEMSTTDEAEVKRLGALVQAKGGQAVDCPVSGGCHRADTGNISIFAGCDRHSFEAVFAVSYKNGAAYFAYRRSGICQYSKSNHKLYGHGKSGVLRGSLNRRQRGGHGS